ncbi:MAG: hypothetical protein QXT72_03540 [Candidatus Micrarchaeia archaeon]
MKKEITFKIGPAVIKIEGQHILVKWAQNVFCILECNEEPGLIFRFVNHPIDLPEQNVVGDGRSFVGDRVMSYKEKYYDVKINSGKPFIVELYQRDRRNLFVRSLIDIDEAWKTWLTHGASLNIKLLKDFVYSIFPFILQCFLLPYNAALIHASGFSINTKAVLLPAWGGVGKTTIMSHFVLRGGAKFLADDYAIVDTNGKIYLYTLPIHTYLYHLEQDRELREKVMSSLSKMNRLQWYIGKIIKPMKVVRWISPVTIFGRNKMVDSGEISFVVVLFRGKTSNFVWEPCSSYNAAITCASIIMSEIKTFTERIARAEAGWHKSIFPSLGDMHRMLIDIYNRAFSRAYCVRLMIPEKTDGSTLVEYLSNKCPLLKKPIEGVAFNEHV